MLAAARGNDSPPGLSSVYDVLAGVAEVVRMGVGDADHLYLFGHSAGGHLVNRIVTVDHRFRAAVCWEGHADPRLGFCLLWGGGGLDNARAIFGGNPWQVPERYRADSALAHVADVRTLLLLLFEGIMGAGKTTTAQFLTEELRRRGIVARFLPEGPTFDAPTHPLRIAPELSHPFAPWLDLTIDAFIERSIQKWWEYVRQAEEGGGVTVSDGLLFHGNLTDLLLMDAEPPILHRYATQIVEVTRPLQPTVIYFYHADVEAALRAVCDERGSAWEAYQVNWKVSSPYATRRGLRGFTGLVQLYRDYRALCDAILPQLGLPILAIRNEGDWARYYAEILSFLGLHDNQV